MKNILAIVFVALLLVGCDKSNPTAVNTSAATGDVAFSEASMYKTVTATDSEYESLERDSVAHNSHRHGKMIGTLKWFVGLTDAQVESVKVYGKTLFETLQSIRQQVRDSVITKDEAKILVQAARDQFIASVKMILTADQLAKFEEWIVKFWNKHHHRRHGHHEGEEYDDHGGQNGYDGHGGRH